MLDILGLALDFRTAHLFMLQGPEGNEAVDEGCLLCQPITVDLHFGNFLNFTTKDCSIFLRSMSSFNVTWLSGLL